MKIFFAGLLLVVSLASGLHGCDSDPFPVGESFVAGFEVPFVTTRTFHFRTGTDEVTGLQANLQIISGADVQNLLNASPDVSSQDEDKGVISGRVIDASGLPLERVAIGGRDASGIIIEEDNGAVRGGVKNAEGQISAPLLYNSINGIPQFINTFGTSASGGFTALNVPPGQHFVSAVQGGRGNDWFTAFAGGLSLMDLDVVPVKLPTVQVTGIVTERDSDRKVPQAEINLLGIGGQLVSQENGLYSGGGLAADSRFLLKLHAAGQVDTYQELSTDLSLLQAGVITPDITQNLEMVSFQDLSALAQSAGTTLVPGRGTLIGKVTELGGRKSAAVVSAADLRGNALGEVFYFPEEGSLPACCLSGTDSSGRFVIFNLPPGDIFLSARAETDSAIGTGRIQSVGRALGFAFGDAVSLVKVAITSLGSESPPPPGTVGMSGTVRDENGLAVGGAQIHIFNPEASPTAISSADGTYTVLPAADPKALRPLLANSTSLVRLEKPGSHLPTYQNVTTGTRDLVRDLEVVSQNLIGPTAGSGAIFGRVVNRKPGGRVDKIKIRATQILNAGRKPVSTGEVVGNIVYFQGVLPDPNLTETSESGRFLIKNLAPGWVMLKTDSSDDSGNQSVPVFPDSVSLANLPANHVPITVPVSGLVKNLRGGPEAAGADLHILGEQQHFSGADLESSRMDFPANGNFIVQVEKAGRLPSFNYGLRTGLVPLTEKTLFSSSLAELQALSAQGGISLDMEKGVVAGQVFESGRKFSSLTLLAGAQPKALATGFFNEDSLPDLAVANDSGSIDVFLGQPGSPLAFAPRISSAVFGSDPRSMAAGDFNRDGRTDLAVAYAGSKSVSVLSSNGKGGFIERLKVPFAISTTSTETPPTLSPVFIATADLNQDGQIDLTVAVEAAGGAISDHVVSFSGDGTGGFSTENTLCPQLIKDTDTLLCAVKPQPIAIVAGDFNGDNAVDLATASAGDSQITLKLSGGAPASSPIAGISPAGMATMDLNGDGILDLAVANSGSDSISSFLGDGNGGFARVDCNLDTEALEDCPLPAGISRPGQLFSSDFDGDGRPDLAVLTEGRAMPLILPGIGDGRFAEAATAAASSPAAKPMTFSVADLDLNGLNDFIVISSGSLNLSLSLSELAPASGVLVEARDTEGNVVGSVRYQSAEALDIDPSRSSSDANGRFIIFNVPLGLTRIRGVRPAGSGLDALVGSTTLDLTQAGSLYFSDLKVARGLPGDVLLDGLSCRPVGIVCSRVGNAKVAFLGASKAEVCRSDPDCITSGVNGAFVGVLDPHSDYVVQLLGPDVTRPGDTDGDGVSDLQDNCPNIANPNQRDSNGNRIGDACELQNSDDDGDGIPNGIDNCRFTPNPGQRDDDQDGIGNLCDQTPTR